MRIPKAQKRQSGHQCLLAHLGSLHLKAARKTLVKLTSSSKDILGSISSMFYEQLLHGQISKAQKKKVKLSVVFTLSGSVCAKAACRTLMTLTPSLLK